MACIKVLEFQPDHSKRATVANDLTSQLAAKASQFANRTGGKVLVVVQPEGFAMTAAPVIFHSPNMTDQASMLHFVKECMTAEDSVTISTHPEHYQFLGVSGKSYKDKFGDNPRHAIPRSGQRKKTKGFGLNKNSIQLPIAKQSLPQVTMDADKSEVLRRLTAMQSGIMAEILRLSPAPPL